MEQKPVVKAGRVLSYAGAFMAFLIGSGFATGQEVLQYFASYGLGGGLLVALTCVILFIFVGGCFICAGKRETFAKGSDVYRYYCGKYIGTFYDYFAIIFIFLSYIVMIAGAGATLNQHFGLPTWMGSIGMMVLVCVTAIFGLSGIIEVIGKMGPVIAVLAIFLGIYSFLSQPAQVLESTRMLCTGFVLASAAVGLVRPVRYLFGPLPFAESPFFEALYVGLLALLVCAAREARDGNRVFRLFWTGLGAVGVGMAALCLVSPQSRRALAGAAVMAVRHAPMPLLQWWGTVLLMLGAAVSVFVLVWDAADTQARLAVQTERSERLDYALAVQKQFYETKLSREEELRALRHNMRGHFSTLSALLCDGRTGEARQYLAEVSTQAQTSQAEAFCENPYMNAALGAYARRFREHRVAFVFRAGVDEADLPGLELSMILNNALENALDASLRLPEGERSVKLQAAVRQQQFLLRVSNRFDGELRQQDGLPVTTKPDKGHGYGLASIRQAAERLGGGLAWRVEEGYFVLDVHFAVPDRAGEGR